MKNIYILLLTICMVSFSCESPETSDLTSTTSASCSRADVPFDGDTDFEDCKSWCSNDPDYNCRERPVCKCKACEFCSASNFEIEL